MFNTSPADVDIKLNNFPKYVRRQVLARFIAQEEIFRLQLNIKGSIVECGVHHGGGLMTWAKLSSIFEPYNYHRQVIGFDTFKGFPSINNLDKESKTNTKLDIGGLSPDYDVLSELKDCIDEYDDNRFLNSKNKIQLVEGDANIEIPNYLKANKHLLVSLLYLDFDIYEPTLTALENFLPRMPKGSVIAFDELNNPDWPGETMAFLESMKRNYTKLKCCIYEPNISYLELL